MFLQSFCVECKVIWDEVGEFDSKRDAMLLDIEHMCLDFYKKKVDEAKLYRAQIHCAQCSVSMSKTKFVRFAPL